MLLIERQTGGDCWHHNTEWQPSGQYPDKQINEVLKKIRARVVRYGKGYKIKNANGETLVTMKLSHGDKKVFTQISPRAASMRMYWATHSEE
jgi:hypothetical protein